MLFFMSAVVVFALLTAAVALFLAISAMKGKRNYTYLPSRQAPSVRICTNTIRLWHKYISYWPGESAAERYKKTQN